MPVEFDPEWEYYVPDEDLQEDEYDISPDDVFGTRYQDNRGYEFGTTSRRASFKKECRQCKRLFRPWSSHQSQIYCCRDCFNKDKQTIRTPEQEKRFRYMWEEGFTYADIAFLFKIEERTVATIRDRLGLEKRRPKNFSVQRRKDMVMREKLPDRRRSWTQKVKILDNNTGKYQTFYVTFGEYPDGRLGEIWIEANKEGTFVRGALGSMAKFMSLNLQTKVPLETVIGMIRGSSFPPNGRLIADGSSVKECESICDFIAREIEEVYLFKKATRPVHYTTKDGRFVFTLLGDDDKPLPEPELQLQVPEKHTPNKLETVPGTKHSKCQKERDDAKETRGDAVVGSSSPVAAGNDQERSRGQPVQQGSDPSSMAEQLRSETTNNRDVRSTSDEGSSEQADRPEEDRQLLRRKLL